MKIICTEAEYKALKTQFKLRYCPFLYMEKNWECQNDCDKCTEENIDWKIIQEVDFSSFKKNCARCNWVEDFGNKCICKGSIYYGEEVLKWGEPIHKPCDQWKTLED